MTSPFPLLMAMPLYVKAAIEKIKVSIVLSRVKSEGIINKKGEVIVGIQYDREALPKIDNYGDH